MEREPTSTTGKMSLFDQATFDIFDVTTFFYRLYDVLYQRYDVLYQRYDIFLSTLRNFSIDVTTILYRCYDTTFKHRHYDVLLPTLSLTWTKWCLVFCS
jgi:hypothetical protein